MRLYRKWDTIFRQQHLNKTVTSCNSYLCEINIHFPVQEWCLTWDFFGWKKCVLPTYLERVLTMPQCALCSRPAEFFFGSRFKPQTPFNYLGQNVIPYKFWGQDSGPQARGFWCLSLKTAISRMEILNIVCHGHTFLAIDWLQDWCWTIFWPKLLNGALNIGKIFDRPSVQHSKGREQWKSVEEIWKIVHTVAATSVVLST